MCAGGKRLVSIRRHQTAILKTHAKRAGNIDAGLNSDDRAFRKGRFVARRKKRLLVDVDADTMPQAMPHLSRISACGKHLFGMLMHRGAGDARANHRLAFLIRAPKRIESAAKLGRHLLDENRSRHIRAVAGFPRAEIHHDRVAPLDDGIARLRMRTASMRSRRDNRGEGQTVGTGRIHEAVKLELHFPLGHARADETRDMCETRVGDRLRGLQPLDFEGILHRTQAKHGLGTRDQFGCRAVLREGSKQCPVLEQADLIVETHPRHFAQTGGTPFGMRLADGVHRNGPAFRFTFASLDIARVGMEDGFIRGNQQQMRLFVIENAIKSACPDDVGGVAYEKSVKLLFLHPIPQARYARARCIAVCHRQSASLVDRRHIPQTRKTAAALPCVSYGIPRPSLCARYYSRMDTHDDIKENAVHTPSGLAKTPEATVGSADVSHAAEESALVPDSEGDARAANDSKDAAESLTAGEGDDTLADEITAKLVDEGEAPTDFETQPTVAFESENDTKADNDAEAEREPLILVIHASVGSGHKSAAQAIAQALEELRDSGDPAYPDGSPLAPNTRIEVLDALDFSRIHFNGDKVASSFTGGGRPFYDLTWRYTFTGRLLWGGGTCMNTFMFPRFTQYVRDNHPQAVIATHIMGANIAVGARLLTHQNYPVVSVPTDYETEGFWPHYFTDAFCVGTEYMAETLRARTIPEQRIRITGIPTRSEFLRNYDMKEAREEFGLPQEKKVVAILAGANLPAPYRLFRESINEILPYLHRYTDMHFVVTAGRDQNYAEDMRQRIRDIGLSNVTIIDYCEEMAQLMAACDLAVCKSGGLTVTECLCSSTPMILMGRAYGQEKANMNMLTGNGAAMHVTTPRELRAALDRFSANPRLLDSMLFNANLLRKPNASRDVAKIALELVAHPEEHESLHFLQRHPALFLMKLYFGGKPAHIR